MQRKKREPRIVILSCILIAVLLLYTARLFDWQILHRDEHINQSLSTTATYTSISAARGEILDRYGRPFATSSQGYSIVFNKIYLPDSEINRVIITLTNLLSSTNEQWTDNCPITKTVPYAFEETDSISPATMISELSLAHYATVQNCVDAMIEKFEISDYPPEQQRTIMGIRLTMLVADYADTIPYTFAQSVSLDTVTKIAESSATLPGVETQVVTMRQYLSGAIAPHLIGQIGPIYAEEWDALKDSGYSYNDYVGKSGIEQYAESFLRGKSGTRKTTRDSQGNVLSSEITEQPVAGNTVMLTLDRNLQQVAQDSLETLIKYRASQKGTTSCNAGSIVVMKVNTGEILAAVTYPSYDINSYKTDYNKLLSDSDLPLFNRALNGVYAPGSTFKAATATIGLQTGVITGSETINCLGTYTYYPNYPFSCMHTHGSLNVVSALKVSCNYFFYETGRRIGITKLNEYCRKFGLGVSTGVELPESTGILAGRAYRESIGSYWNDGDTLQAAIGQSDNGFTPLQLAVYTSTLANGGTRYKAHFINEIRSSDLNTLVKEQKPEPLDTLGVSQEYVDIVKKGMLSVTSEGSVSSVFGDYPIAVGGKTGTATVIDHGVEYNNGVFIAFAPYESPEIAVIIIAEKAGYGSGCSQPAQDIFNAYFFYNGETYTAHTTDTLTQ